MIVARKPRSELRELARDLVTNRAWGTNNARELELSFGFLLSVAMANATEAEKRALNNVGFVYAPTSSALPRSINAVPMFMEAAFVHVNDMDYLIQEVARMEEALNPDARTSRA